MTRNSRFYCWGIGLALSGLAAGGAMADPPSFSLAWSEYPSWSAFGVAHEYKLIHG